MSEDLVQRFIDGLHHLEESGDPAPLIATYAEDAETSNVVAERTFEGKEGARDFWHRYRAAFGEVRSSFRNVIVSDDRAALEWTTEGTDPEGSAVPLRRGKHSGDDGGRREGRDHPLSHLLRLRELGTADRGERRADSGGDGGGGAMMGTIGFGDG